MCTMFMVLQRYVEDVDFDELERRTLDCYYEHVHQIQDNQQLGPKNITTLDISDALDSAFAIGVSHHPCLFPVNMDMHTTVSVIVLFLQRPLGLDARMKTVGLTPSGIWTINNRKRVTRPLDNRLPSRWPNSFLNPGVGMDMEPMEGGMMGTRLGWTWTIIGNGVGTAQYYTTAVCTEG